jgi:SAM-dependent methyltransferase
MIEPNIRYFWVLLRALYFIKLRRRLVSIGGDNTVESNFKHNVKAVFGVNNRMTLLIYPLSVVETLGPASRILVIGPRNENDIFMLTGLGFDRENIVGLDLISYSPLIRLGDMHELPFEDDSFDAVVCGWTLSYSTNPGLACREIKRVVRDRGVVAVAVEYSTLTAEDEVELVGYKVQDFGKVPRRVNSVTEILALFESEVGEIYFSHDAPRKVSHSSAGLVPNVSNVAVVFEKRASGTPDSK